MFCMISLAHAHDEVVLKRRFQLGWGEASGTLPPQDLQSDPEDCCRYVWLNFSGGHTAATTATARLRKAVGNKKFVTAGACWLRSPSRFQASGDVRYDGCTTVL